MGELKSLWRQASDTQKRNVGAPAWKPTPETGGLQETGLHSGFKSLLSIRVLLLPVGLGSRPYFVPRWINLSISPRSPWDETAAGGRRAQPGVMAGQGDRLRQKTFGLGNTPSEKRERLGEGRERRRRRRRGAGQSRPVGIHGILNPSIGHCPQAGLLSPEVASWKVAWGAQGGPGGTAHPPTPSAVRETWERLPQNPRDAGCVYSGPSDQLSGACEWREIFLMMALSTIMISLWRFSIFKAVLFSKEKGWNLSLMKREDQDPPLHVCLSPPRWRSSLSWAFQVHKDGLS